MKKKSIFSVILSVMLLMSMTISVFAATGSGMGAASATVNSTDNSMLIKEDSRYDTNGASYQYTLKSANNYELADGTVVFAYKDIQELAKDIVDIRNYLNAYGIGGSGSASGMIMPYDRDHIYNAYDYVIYENAIWRCKHGKSNVTGDFEPSLWDKIIATDDIYSDTYDPDEGYVEGQFTIYNSILWCCRQDIPAPAGNFDESKWAKQLPIFDSTNYYMYVRRLQKYADTLQALVDKLKAETAVTGAKDYDPSATYNEGDMCLYENKLYICIGQTSGDFDSTKWAEVDPSTGVGAQAATNEAKFNSAAKDITNLEELFASTGIQVKSTARRDGTDDDVINAVFDVENIDLHVNGDYRDTAASGGGTP